MEDSKKDMNCPICSSTSSNPFCLKNGYTYMTCKHCLAIYVWPLDVDINLVYTPEYFSGGSHGFGYVNYDEDKQAMRGTFIKYLEQIERWSSKSRDLLDVGAATGFFMQIARRHGWGVAGVELSSDAADIGRKRGLDIVTGDIFSEKLNGRIFDVVTMWDVIEHLKDPIAVMRRVKTLLRPDGVLAINTPDSGSLWARLLRKRWQALIPPEHLILFNATSLSALLARSGFRLVEQGKISKSFSLAYIASTFLQHRVPNVMRTILNSKLGAISVPLDVRDNQFVIARNE
jgi:SAM-dependent methyltransferase